MTKPFLLLPLALLTFGLGSVAGAASPDRCATLGDDGYPRHCAPVGQRVAPVWDASACCEGSQCVEPGPLGCPADTREYTCAFARPDGQGALECLFVIPHYCDEHPCPEPSAAFKPDPAANAICCYEEGCYDPEGGICGGIMYWCDDGVSNEDGTVTCFDDDVPE